MEYTLSLVFLALQLRLRNCPNIFNSPGGSTMILVCFLLQSVNPVCELLSLVYDMQLLLYWCLYMRRFSNTLTPGT